MLSSPSSPLLMNNEALVRRIKEAPESAVRELLILLDRAMRCLTSSRTVSRQNPQARFSLVPGGVVLITEDGRGIARAVAADLRALGYPVLRVRHGVSSNDVEGTNLASSASVAALVERARGLGPVAAIVHLAALRERSTGYSTTSAFDADDRRMLSLLLWASAEELVSASKRGGACFLIALPHDRRIDPPSRGLGGVRFPLLEIHLHDETEVIAAMVVQKVLESQSWSTTLSIGPSLEPRSMVLAERSQSQAILLGAPDRSAWQELSSALFDVLNRSSELKLADLSTTLHLGQPPYPFRVGLVGTSVPDLMGKLAYVNRTLQDQSCHSIHITDGIYWTDPEWSDLKTWNPDSRKALSWPIPDERAWRTESDGGPDALSVSIPFPTARDWLHHEVASRFGHGHPVRHDLLIESLTAKTAESLGQSVERNPNAELNVGRGHALLLNDAIRLMDDILENESHFVLDLLRA